MSFLLNPGITGAAPEVLMSQPLLQDHPKIPKVKNPIKIIN